jgi:hypothetical protein
VAIILPLSSVANKDEVIGSKTSLLKDAVPIIDDIPSPIPM